MYKENKKSKIIRFYCEIKEKKIVKSPSEGTEKCNFLQKLEFFRADPNESEHLRGAGEAAGKCEVDRLKLREKYNFSRNFKKDIFPPPLLTSGAKE